jgi:hypothetical protein
VGRLLSVVCAAALALPVATAAASPAGGAYFYEFRTPSGNIGCVAGTGYLRCDIRGGIKPLPPKPRNCDLDWGGGFSLGPKGSAAVVCAGDTALNRSPHILKYGTSWRHGVFTCLSRRVGLRCSNSLRHGFFLSLQHSYRF